MDKLRYINVGHTDGKVESALWEFPNLMEKQQPTLIVRQPLKDELGCLGNQPLADLVNVDQLGNTDICRFNIGDSPGMLHTSSAIHCHLVYPSNSKQWIERTIKATIFKTLKEFGIDCEESRNDIFVNHDGKNKKIFGSIITTYSDWLIIGFTLTFDINYDLANKIYNFDSEKFVEKGDITDLRDISVGLYELNPTLDSNALIDNFVQKLATRLELVIEESSLTTLESTQLYSLADTLDEKSWTEEGICPQ